MEVEGWGGNSGPHHNLSDRSHLGTSLCSYFPGGPLQNGQPSAEIQEEVALTSLGSGPAATNKRHSTSDKMHFPRASLQPITTLGRLPGYNAPA